MAASTDKSVLDANELQQQLEEKDQLVLALTERLEEAAEQLDRAHRSGTDKGGRAGSGAGLAHDALTQQQTLIEQLSKSVEVWEDVQPRDAFARIEARLDEGPPTAPERRREPDKRGRPGQLGTVTDIRYANSESGGNSPTASGGGGTVRLGEDEGGVDGGRHERGTRIDSQPPG